jgi:hypothetical protein
MKSNKSWAEQHPFASEMIEAIVIAAVTTALSYMTRNASQKLSKCTESKPPIVSNLASGLFNTTSMILTNAAVDKVSAMISGRGDRDQFSE